MDRPTFDALVDETLDRVRHLNATKGRDYAGDADVLADFRGTADALGVEPMVALMVGMTKQWRAVNSFVRDGELRSEGIRGRLDDLIVYALLLQAMIADDGRQSAAVQPPTKRYGSLADRVVSEWGKSLRP